MMGLPHSSKIPKSRWVAIVTFEPENLVIHCMLKYVESPGKWGEGGGGEIFGDFFSLT